MTTFKTAKERAEDAQAAFAAFLVAEAKNRDEFGTLLESMFSTAQIANNNTSGVLTRTSHTAFSKRLENKVFFETLESQTWRLHAAGASAEVIYGSVRAAAESQKRIIFLPFDVHLSRIRAATAQTRTHMISAR